MVLDNKETSSNNHLVFYLFLNCGDLRKKDNGSERHGKEYENNDAVNQGRFIISTGEIRFSINKIDQGVAFQDIERDNDLKYGLKVDPYHRESKIEIVAFCRQ